VRSEILGCLTRKVTGEDASECRHQGKAKKRRRKGWERRVEEAKGRKKCGEGGRGKGKRLTYKVGNG